MRHATGDFAWLKRHSAEYRPFMRDLTGMLTAVPVIGIACVIDRPGYDGRYRAKYGRRQWQLCKTAFAIIVERALKFVRRSGGREKLRVLPERCSFDDDNRLLSYYTELRNEGMPFDAGSSAGYAPLLADEFRAGLHEIRFKGKSSPPMQIADLYLWPMVTMRYKGNYRPHTDLCDAGRLIESRLAEAEVLACGSKYSCFELVDRARIRDP